MGLEGAGLNSRYIPNIDNKYNSENLSIKHNSRYNTPPLKKSEKVKGFIDDPILFEEDLLHKYLMQNIWDNYVLLQVQAFKLKQSFSIVFCV